MQRVGSVLIRMVVCLCVVSVFALLPSTSMAKQMDKAQKSESMKDTSVVDINSADLAALTSLPGIGQKTAENIISYRNEHGAFQSVDDLKNVNGIGEKKLENLKSMITVSTKKETTEKTVKETPTDASKMASKKP